MASHFFLCVHKSFSPLVLCSVAPVSFSLTIYFPDCSAFFRKPLKK